MRLLLGFCCAGMLSLFAGAESSRPLPVELALKAASFAELMPISTSPDGRFVAYTVRDNQRSRALDSRAGDGTGIRDLETGTDIWISELGTGAARNLTGGKFDNFMPAWSPDNRYLAFISDRDGSGHAELWIWDAKTDALKRVSERTINTSQIEWTSDHKLIVTAPPEVEDKTQDHEPGLVEEDHLSREPTRARISLFRAGEDNLSGEKESHQADAWDLDWARRSLLLIDVRSGHSQTLLQDARIAHFAISPDGAHIAYTSTTHFESAGSQQILYDLRTFEILSHKQETLARDVRLGFKGLFSWAPDSSSVAFRTYGPGEKTFDCYVVNLRDGARRNISNLRAMPLSAGPVSENELWSANGKFVYFISRGALWRAAIQQGSAVEVARIPGRQITAMIAQSPNVLWTSSGGTMTAVLTHDDVGKQDGVYQVQLEDGSSSKLLEDQQCYSCTHSQDPVPLPVPGDLHGVLYFSEDAGHSPDLWLASPDFKTRKQITHLNPQFDNYHMGSARLLRWLSDDGEPLQGVLLLPSDYQQTKRYPLVVWTYGGVSLSNSLDRFGAVGPGPLNMQLLATRGYAVFLPDSPQHLGAPMLDLAKTVLPGVSKLVEMGIADPQRLGVIGHSNGGYSVLALIVQTNRFKAAVEVSGMADLVANYGEMDESGGAFATSYLEHGLDGMGGTPWQVPIRYLENSPIFYLDRVKTPLLLIHGSADQSVEPFLGDEVFVAMRRLGKQAEYVKYMGEPHSPLYWTFTNQKDFCDRVISWFDRHLGSR